MRRTKTNASRSFSAPFACSLTSALFDRRPLSTPTQASRADGMNRPSLRPDYGWAKTMDGPSTEPNLLLLRPPSPMRTLERPSMRPIAELQVASAHVNYEWTMLQVLAWRLENRDAIGIDYYARCAFMEAFTIHARALHDFLWLKPNSNHPHDIRSVEYFAEGGWQRPKRAAVLKKLPRDVGKYIAHLSHLRPSPGNERQWPHTVIADELTACMRKFQEDVERDDPSRLSDEWRQPLPTTETVHRARIKRELGDASRSSSSYPIPLDVQTETGRFPWAPIGIIHRDTSSTSGATSSVVMNLDDRPIRIETSKQKE